MQYLLKNEHENIEEIVEITHHTDKLNIDEIIPLFDPNSKIELFKGNICQLLKQYNQDIDSLKIEMDSFAKQADEWNKELLMMKNNYIQFDSH